MGRNENRYKSYLHLFQPLHLVLILLTYSIGPGLIHFQGRSLNWPNILLGSLLGVFLLLVKDSLSAFFDHPDSPVSTLHHDDPRLHFLRNLQRQTLLVISLTFLTAGALSTILIIIRDGMLLPAILILGLAFLGTIFSVLPPLRFEKNGYGDVFEAVLVCNLVPALGYLMNDSNLHFLLITITLPMTFVFLAYKILQSLESYGFDSTHGYRTLAVRLDWKRSMMVHNYVILTAFLFVGIFPLFGQPWSITWPVLLTIPVAVFQILQMIELMSGAPTRWRLLKLISSGTIVIMAYLISFTLWIR